VEVFRLNPIEPAGGIGEKFRVRRREGSLEDTVCFATGMGE
jgi:hypothetical protein